MSGASFMTFRLRATPRSRLKLSSASLLRTPSKAMCAEILLPFVSKCASRSLTNFKIGSTRCWRDCRRSPTQPWRFAMRYRAGVRSHAISTMERLRSTTLQPKGLLRGVALGRKNYLFCGSDAGGHSAAAIYLLIGTAKLNGVEPELYLQRVLEKIPDWPISRITELLPWNFSESQINLG